MAEVQVQAPSASTSTSGFTSPAPYGRACANCARSKCKCMLRPGNLGGACERCHRLKKDCIPTQSVRRRPAKKTASRTAQLEEKLDDLVTLLRSSARTGASGLPSAVGRQAGEVVEGRGGGIVVSGPGAGPTVADPIVEAIKDATEAGVLPACESRRDMSASSSTLGTSRDGHLPTPSTTTAAYPPSYPSPVSHLAPLAAPEDLTLFEAEECLEHFRSQKLRYFPFMHIPPGLTAAQLQQERPFLWMCILCVTVKSSARQLAIGNKVRRLLAEKLLVDHERSLETLLGLLAFMGWANYQLGVQPFMAMYSHLIIALTQDLGIDKPPPKDTDQHPMACVKGHGFAVRLPISKFRSMEERRAVLSAYLLTSLLSCFVRKLDALKWTPHMDECLQILEEKHETPLDLILIYQVKMQLIVEEVPKTPPWPSSEPPDHLKIFQVFQVKALQARVEDIRKSLPAYLQTDNAILLPLYATELQINEIGLYTPQSKPTVPDAARLSMLTASLHCAKQWFEIFLSLPASTYTHFGFAVLAELSHFSVALYRLLTLDEPDWDRRAARETIDLLHVLEIMEGRFASVPAEAGIINDRPDGDIFTRSVRAVKAMRNSWEPAIVGTTQQQAISADPNSEGGPATTAMLPAAGAAGLDTVILEDLSTDFAEGFNGWLNDMFMPWEAMDLTGSR